MSFRTIESSPSLPQGLSFVTVKSAALGQRADLTLWSPPDTEPGAVMPLVILLHGVYGSHWAWALKGDAHLTAQRLIDSGAITPMRLAMPSDGLWGDGSGYVAHTTGQDFEQWIVEEVPAAAGHVGGAPIFIAGFGALRMAGKYPGRFAAAAGHSSITEAHQLDALMAESRAGWSVAPQDQSVLAALTHAAAPVPPLRFDCGLDDPFLQANRALHQSLDAAGIAHDYAEHPGGHEWPYWSRHLEDTLRFFASTLKGWP
jgi:putative tributyrin esterase